MNSRSDRRISQDLKRTLRANNKAVIYNGTAIASNQGKVLVYVPALGQQIQAIAMGAVPTGPCQIYKTNSGWVVKSEVTNQVTREQGSDRRNRETFKTPDEGNIKILFSKPIPNDPHNRREYWLGGDRKEPIKVYEDPPPEEYYAMPIRLLFNPSDPSRGPNDPEPVIAGEQVLYPPLTKPVTTPVYFHNTGKGEDDWLLCRTWTERVTAGEILPTEAVEPPEPVQVDQKQTRLYTHGFTRQKILYKTGTREWTRTLLWVARDFNGGNITGETIDQLVPGGTSARFTYKGNGCFVIILEPMFNEFYDQLSGNYGEIEPGYGDPDIRVRTYMGGGDFVVNNIVFSTAPSSGLEINTYISHGSSSSSDRSFTRDHKCTFIRVTPEDISFKEFTRSESSSDSSASSGGFETSQGNRQDGYSVSLSDWRLGTSRRDISYSYNSTGSGQSQNFSNQTAYGEDNTDYVYYHKTSPLTIDAVASGNYTYSSGNSIVVLTSGMEHEYKGRGIDGELSFGRHVRLEDPVADLVATHPVDEDGFLIDGAGDRITLTQTVTFGARDFGTDLGLDSSKPLFLVVKNNAQNEDNEMGFWKYLVEVDSHVWSEMSAWRTIVLRIKKRSVLDWHFRLGIPTNAGQNADTKFTPFLYQENNEKSFASLINTQQTDASYLNGVSYNSVKSYDYRFGSEFGAHVEIGLASNYNNWEEFSLVAPNINYTGKYLTSSMFLNTLLDADQLLWVEGVSFSSNNSISFGGGSTRLSRNLYQLKAYRIQPGIIHYVSAWLP